MSSRLPPARHFAVPMESNVDRVLASLEAHVAVVPDGPAQTDRVYLDTFDGLLHGAGLELTRTAGPDGLRLTLTDTGAGSPLSASLPAKSPDRLLAGDLPEGSLRDAVAAEIDVRALLPLVRVRSTERRARVTDRDDKTVVRLSFEEPVAVAKGEKNRELGTRLIVSPLLGYDDELDRVCALLEDELGLTAPESSVVDEAVAATGGTPGGVSAKVGVPLAPDMRAIDATLLICRRLADIIEQNMPGTIEDIDTEFLHDLRVAVRRTRSVLKEMKHVLAPEVSERAKVFLKWVQEVTGPTRDLDVQLEEWPKLVSGLATEATADLQPLQKLLTRHRDLAFRRMRTDLRSARFRNGWSEWRSDLERVRPKGSAKPKNANKAVAELAGNRIASVYTHMVHDGTAIDDDSEAEALHDLRKKGKELRYLLELYGPLWPRDVVDPMVSTLKGLQDVLGRFQDDQVQEMHLRELGPELAVDRAGTDSLIALGLVIDRLAVDQRAARASFAKRFAPFADDEQRTVVAETFGKSKGAKTAVKNKDTDTDEGGKGDKAGKGGKGKGGR